MRQIAFAAALISSAAAAESGTSFIQRFKALKPAAREAELVKAVNAPSWVTVDVAPAKGAKGNAAKHTGSVRVSQDYVNVGESSDFVRMPMTPQTAQRIADKFDAVLPTKKLVDDVYAAAAVKLKPSPMPNVKVADTPDRYLAHQKTIEAQRAAAGGQGGLIAGIKKDIVIGNMLARAPAKVVIYGWHQPNGKAIQPESSVHGNFYIDYSHGVRLVARQMMVDGQPKDIRDVLKDKELCWLVADQCPVAAKGVAYPLK